uniref:Uncharacterized protein n=1 Tax=Tetranychus urticae TaxID=32264 RepID=T1KKG0_TETUR
MVHWYRYFSGSKVSIEDPLEMTKDNHFREKDGLVIKWESTWLSKIEENED